MARQYKEDTVTFSKGGKGVPQSTAAQRSSSYIPSGDYTGAPKIPEPERVSLKDQGIEVEGEWTSIDDFCKEADVKGQSQEDSNQG